MMMMVKVIFLTSGIGMAGIDAAVKPIARKVKKTFKVALLFFSFCHDCCLVIVIMIVIMWLWLSLLSCDYDFDYGVVDYTVELIVTLATIVRGLL